MATLLTIEKLEKSYGQREIFKSADLTISEKQKIGVIGRNGAGKSTLFRMLIGEEKCDSGKIFIHNNTRLGYLSQYDPVSSDETVIEYLCRQADCEEWRAAKMAGGFDIKNEMLYLPVNSLSGGWRMRLRLASMLLLEPNLFLLDEPTNYLDLRTQILLEKFLQNYSGAFMIISHDREFLKRTCNETLEIENGKMNLYPRPIDEYLEYKEQILAYARKYNKKMEREEKHLQAFVDRFRYKASKAKQAQSKMKAIERIKKIDIDSPMARVKIIIPLIREKKGLCLSARDLSIGYDEKIVAQNINFEINRGERVAILGDNGEGKTTLLKTIAGEIKNLGGVIKLAPDVSLAYYAQHVPDEMNGNEEVIRYLRKMAPRDIMDEEVKRMAGNFLFTSEDYDKQIGVLSGGERARLCLAGLLLSRSNLLIFDEPTNHLDFETVEALALALSEFAGTILFVSHNRSFVNTIATNVFEVGGGKVRHYPGTYEEFVYHLENLNEEKEDLQKVKKIEKQDDAPKEILDNKESLKKEKRKELKKIENDLEEWGKIKNKLLKKQADNPFKFSIQNYSDLGEATKKVEELEEKWLALQE